MRQPTKREVEEYFGVDIDHIQRQWDLTHSYEVRNIEKEYIRLYKIHKAYEENK